jgi:hypothetical protein
VLVTGLLLDVWSATAAELERLEAGLPAVKQMVVHCTALHCTALRFSCAPPRWRLNGLLAVQDRSSSWQKSSLPCS